MAMRLPTLFALTFVVAAAACAEGEKDYVVPSLVLDGGRRDGATFDAGGGGDDAGPGDDAAIDAALDAPNRPDASDGSVAFVPPTVDGVVNVGEYGVHTNGMNQQVSDVGTTTWLMTWDDTKLYIGITNAAVGEALVLYIDTAPLAVSNGGTNADGSLAGYSYDGTSVTLPIRADFALYAKSTYNEGRKADGAGSFGAPTVSVAQFAGTGNTREIAIPWTAISASGRPAKFSFTGYLTSSSGFVYGEMPPANPGNAALAVATPFPSYYKVDPATPGTGAKPFSTPLP